MPSLVELAELCKAAYNQEDSVDVDMGNYRLYWEKEDFWSNTNFYAALYTTTSGQKVLAYRGTDDLADALIDDVAIVAGSIPPQLTYALQIASSLSHQKPILTGHSLGGALAVICAAQYNLKAVSFNAPGVMDSCIRTSHFTGLRQGLSALLSAVGRCISNPNIVNIRVEADPVSSFFTTGLQSGNTITVSAKQCGFNALCRHGIQTCIDQMRNSRDGFDPIQL